MGYGRLNPRQLAALEPHVRGHHIHDLGAGNLDLARELVCLGAEVTAIDKNPMPLSQHRRIRTRQCRFDDLLSDPPAHIFLSWPVNRADAAVLTLVMLAKTTVYLGSNLDGSACGFEQLFKALLYRELVGHEPDRPNTLLVYQGYRKNPREPVWEEHAALNQHERVFRYRDYPQP
jgi:hypothetical protein